MFINVKTKVFEYIYKELDNKGRDKIFSWLVKPRELRLRDLN